jgi:hypothetical protein
MRKITAVVVIMLLLIFMIMAAGCAAESKEGVTSGSWLIYVEDGAGKKVEFTEKDAAGLELAEVTAVLSKDDGSEETENWKGVLLSDVLGYCGVEEYEMLAVEASDGYTKELDASTVNDKGTILGLFLDGQEISREDGLVRMVVSTMNARAWIKNVSRIYVVK